MIIVNTKSINGIYTELLVKKRELEREIEKGEVECVHCGKKLNQHVNGRRCNHYSLAEFLSHHSTTVEKIAKALNLLEELEQIGV